MIGNLDEQRKVDRLGFSQLRSGAPFLARHHGKNGLGISSHRVPNYYYSGKNIKKPDKESGLLFWIINS
jgi:hypothetical protein